jgi:uncharacterized repeat protein (TIGR01451 family)
VARAVLIPAVADRLDRLCWLVFGWRWERRKGTEMSFRKASQSGGLVSVAPTENQRPPDWKRALSRHLVLAAALMVAQGCSGSTPARSGSGGQAAGGTSGLGGSTSLGGKSGGVAGVNGAGGTNGGAGQTGTAGTTGAGGAGAAVGAGGSAGGRGGSGNLGGGGHGVMPGIGGSNGVGGGFQQPASALTFDVSTIVNPVAPGSRLLFNITVGNVSTVAVDGVTVVWLLPTGLQFTYSTDAEPNSSGCSVCSANGQATWSLGTLPAGTTRTISVNPQVLQTVGDGDVISTSFKLTATGLNPATFPKSILIGAKPSAQLSTGTSTSPLLPGQHVTLDLDAGQLGTIPLSGVALRATIPAGLTVVSASAGGTQTAPGVVDWTLGALDVGAAVHRTVDLTVDANVLPGSVLKTTSTLTYDGGAAIDATSEHAITVVGTPPSLLVNVASSASPVVPGQDVHYTITVSNRETRAIDNVILLLRTPLGLQFTYSTDAEPNSSGCSVCMEGGEASWSLGSLPSKSSRTIDLRGSIVASSVGNGNLIRAPFVLTGTGAAEVVSIKTVQVHDNPSAQFVVGSSANPVIPGQAITYAVDIGQIGAAALASGRIHLWLPPELTVAGISDAGTQPTPTEVIWELGTIGVGADLHRSISATVSAAAVPGTILASRAELTYDGGGEIDAVTSDAVSVIELPQSLTLAVSASPLPATPSGRTLYTAVVTNTAARSVDGVSLFLRTPNGLQFTYSSDADPDSSGCSVCTNGGEASWNIGAMAAGASQIITINPQVLSTVLQGTLIPTPFTLNATGLLAPIRQVLVVPTH